MRAYLAFTKKEILEYTRNYKLFVLIILFAILGIMSPLTAKFMPDIIGNFMPEGITIEIQEPTNLDSWMQFFKNGTQTGLIIVVILFSGMMSKEYEKGTLVNMVTKGLPRKTIILSKFTVAVVLWSLSYWLCFLITWAYTGYYFPDGKMLNLGLAVSSLYFFGIVLISVLLLGSVIFKNAYGPLLFVGGFILLLFLVGLFPDAAEWNPLQLASRNMEMLQGTTAFADLARSFLLSGVGILLPLLLSMRVLDKKAL
ncbi:Hypothetical protein Tpal_2179 [Trichococcus palustris]|uniref:Abc-2 type transporter n=1 Tax=Trichococcus palustris TaxID=140314 RepID=A0A143YTJ7_9LACT|nr:ABC transporter permease [Trichococcus palustris]CZQ97795.1 Hypothetical protein Tpal_2179 [Trichococcus palustris]SFL10392.1 ABC-2 type transport system permease protein [Trichococcus palustris]